MLYSLQANLRGGRLPSRQVILEFQPEPKEATAQQMGFVPARMLSESEAAPGPVGPASRGAIEIEFAAGARMRITGTVDAAMLQAAVAAPADGQP
jgi:transposase